MITKYDGEFLIRGPFSLLSLPYLLHTHTMYNRLRNDGSLKVLLISLNNNNRPLFKTNFSPFFRVQDLSTYFLDLGRVTVTRIGVMTQDHNDS